LMLCVFKVFYVKYFRKDIIKVQVVGCLYKHRLLHGKMKIKIIIIIINTYIHTYTQTRSC